MDETQTLEPLATTREAAPAPPAVARSRPSPVALTLAEWIHVLRLHVPAWLMLGACAVGFAACYATAISALVEQWWTNDEYAYGFFIAPISGYLLWQKRSFLGLRRVTGSLVWGIPVLVLGLATLVSGKRAGIILAEELSMVVTLAGIGFVIHGVPVMRAAWFPISYLFLMVPFWDVVGEGLHQPLQLVSGRLAVDFLRFSGIPVYMEGFYLHMPNVAVEVATACSGAKYLISIIAIGIPLAYLFLHTWPRRIALVALAVAIALLSNGVRVALLAYLFNSHQAKMAEGAFHVLHGVLISWIGYAVLFAGVWVLGWRQPRISAPELGVVAPSSAGRGDFLAHLGRSAAVVIGCLLVAAALYRQSPRPVPLLEPLESFPASVLAWTTADVPVSVPESLAMTASQRLSRALLAPSGERGELHVLYHDRQEQGRELIGSESAHLHRGASVIRAGSGPESFEVNRKLETGATGRSLLYFWYELDGRAVASRYRAKIDTAWTAVTRNRSNGALVMVRVQSSDAGRTDLETLDPLGRALVAAVRRELAQQLPAR